MPTYAFRCEHCGRVDEVILSITSYSASPPSIFCCRSLMQRYFESAPALGSVNDRHYEGLAAPDGTLINTRAKHREYMRAHNLTTVDDFKDTWKRAAREQEARMQGHDPSRKLDVAQAIAKLGG